MKNQLLKDATASGLKTLRLIPLLLGSGNHFEKDVQEIKAEIAGEFDVEIAAPIKGEKFSLLDEPELIRTIETQVSDALTRLGVTH